MVVGITCTGITFSIATKVVVIITIIMDTVVTAAITIIIGSTTTKVITMINNNTMVIVEIRLHPAVAITIIIISSSTKVLQHQVVSIVVECQYKGNHINKCRPQLNLIKIHEEISSRHMLAEVMIEAVVVNTDCILIMGEVEADTITTIISTTIID